MSICDFGLVILDWRFWNSVLEWCSGMAILECQSSVFGASGNFTRRAPRENGQQLAAPSNSKKSH